MSYSGYEEYICEKGHYHSVDCLQYESNVNKCSICDSRMQWFHPVDTTNGEDKKNPMTFPGKKEIIGFDEKWQKDHRGNNYAIKIHLYKPGQHWRRI